MKAKPSFRHLRPAARQQRGVALAVALVLLVVITLTGLGAMRNAIQQERMSGNSVDRALAMQAAESALQEAQRLIQDSKGQLPTGAVNCTKAAACPANPNAQQNGISGIEWYDVSASYQPPSDPFPAIVPQYAIQYLGQYTERIDSPEYGGNAQVNHVQLYRVNARSYDPDVTNNRAFVVLQATAKVENRLE